MTRDVDALTLVAAGAPLAASLEAVARAEIASSRQQRACIILLTDPGGSHLHIGAVAGLGDEHAFTLDGVILGPDAGPSGRAIWRGELVVATDGDAQSGECQLGRRLGLPGCWAAPLPSRSQRPRQGAVLVLGANGDPTPEEERQTSAAAALVAIALDRERDSREIDRRRSHDILTGLVNRRTLLEHVSAALSRSRKLASASAVLLIDLDGFKVVNDSLGHEAGDRLLVALSERLRRAMRPGDTVGRLGADEFVVVCEDVGGEFQAISIARDVARVVARPFALDGTEIFLTACVGIAIGTDGASPESVLRDADAAAERAKQRGPNHCELFEQDMRSDLVHRMETQNGLRRALERREFTVVFQPEVDLSSGRIVGAEALARWMHPTLGLLGPQEFIPAAEATGLIVPIGAHVLNEACTQLARWLPVLGDRPFTLWVNVSGRQLSQPDLPTVVADALAGSGLVPSSLGLELTESVVMEDAEAAIASLQSLRDLGVGLAIDDFGTGYSSLAYLKRFPVDVLKVDRSFVNGIVSDPDDASIVAAVIGLARVLGKDVVAEGVEEAEQVEALLNLGCRLGQGYHFARPAPPEAVTEMLRAEFLGHRPVTVSS